jgi:hypothetical protein
VPVAGAAAGEAAGDPSAPEPEIGRAEAGANDCR